MLEVLCFNDPGFNMLFVSIPLVSLGGSIIRCNQRGTNS